MSLFEDKNLKTNAISVFLAFVTGENPIIEKHPEFNEILLTENQIKILREKLTDFLERAPGNVRMNLNPVFIPVVIKKYWPWVVGISAGVLALGFILKK